MNDIEWLRPAGCESSGCPEVAFVGPRVFVRSSKRPHLMAILDDDEWQTLCNAITAGDYRPKVEF